MAKPPKLIGAPVRRREDPRLITGHATYVDDVKLPGMVHMAIVRSSYAHARTKAIDVSAAKAAPGVVLVLLGAEVKSASEPLPLLGQLPDMKRPLGYALATDVVRFAGEGVAAVVAGDRYQARDAAELITPEYEELR